MKLMPAKMAENTIETMGRRRRYVSSYQALQTLRGRLEAALAAPLSAEPNQALQTLRARMEAALAAPLSAEPPSSYQAVQTLRTRMEVALAAPLSSQAPPGHSRAVGVPVIVMPV